MTRAKPRLSVTMLWLAHRLMLAVVTVIVCAGITSPARGTVLAASIDVGAPSSANAEQGGAARKASHHWRDGTARRDVDLKALEYDEEDDDEDDRLCHVPDEAPLAFRFVPTPHRSQRGLRGELQVDTSRFAAGTGLPRGPPA